MNYRSFAFYSPDLDAMAVRLSMANGEGQEYYAIVPQAVPGKPWRQRREAALDAIEDAIEVGAAPGQVEVGNA